MEKKRKIHEFDIFNVLPELSTLIFSFLPVRSLLVLRSVCKWFLSIIDDPEFIHFHLRHFPSNALQNRYFSVASGGPDHRAPPFPFRVWRCSAIMLPSPTDRVIIDHFYNPDNVSFENTIDGLVLLTESGCSSFLLWNPSMKKQRRVFAPDMFSELVFLGYDRTSHDYKVLALCWNKPYVYNVNKGTWTALAFDKQRWESLNVIYKNEVNVVIYLSVGCGILFIEEGHRLDMSKTVWFDFETEVFSYPDDAPLDMRKKVYGLRKLDGESTVGILYGYDAEDQPSIWALDTRTMSYTKRYNVCRELMEPYALSHVEKNGELVLKYWKGNSINNEAYLEEVTYDIKTEMIKKHIKIPWQYVHDYYIESMILP